MTTTSEIKKSVEKQMETLTPHEIAQYFFQEWGRMAERAVEGEDTSRDEENLVAIYNRYVVDSGTMADYAKFWRFMYNGEYEHWARFFYEHFYPAIVREQAWIGLLILEKVKSLIGIKNRKRLKPDEGGNQLREEIIELVNRYHEFGSAIERLADTEMWDRLGIKRPDYTDIRITTKRIENWVEDIMMSYPVDKVGAESSV
jgi:hypothetical protein